MQCSNIGDLPWTVLGTVLVSHVRKMYVYDISRKKEFILMPCAHYRLRSMVLVNRRSSVVCRVVLCDQCCKSMLDLSLWTPWTFWYLFFTQCICLSRNLCVLTPYNKKARKFNVTPPPTHPAPSSCSPISYVKICNILEKRCVKLSGN